MDIGLVGTCGVEKFHDKGSVNLDNLGVKRESRRLDKIGFTYLSTSLSFETFVDHLNEVFSTVDSEFTYML